MSDAERTYPAPAMNSENAAYWEAATKGVLLLKTCNACHRTHFYPRAICPHCQSEDTEWFEASGRGKIYTFSVLRRTDVPYALAYIALAEGVTMMANIVHCDFDHLEIGQEVEVIFRPTEGDKALPVFRPV